MDLHLASSRSTFPHRVGGDLSRSASTLGAAAVALVGHRATTLAERAPTAEDWAGRKTDNGTYILNQIFENPCVVRANSTHRSPRGTVRRRGETRGGLRLHTHNLINMSSFTFYTCSKSTSTSAPPEYAPCVNPHERRTDAVLTSVLIHGPLALFKAVIVINDAESITRELRVQVF